MKRFAIAAALWLWAGPGVIGILDVVFFDGQIGVAISLGLRS